MTRTRHAIWRYILLIVAALFVAATCRTLLVELYTVAPGQMENCLLAGDRVMVEKWHYGIRLPQSYLSIPLLDTLPGTKQPAYFPATPLPYRRTTTQVVSRNDVILFNYPTHEEKPLSHYPTAIARCIGVPGDTIYSTDDTLHINGLPIEQNMLVTRGYLVPDSLWHIVSHTMTTIWGKAVEQRTIGHSHLIYIDNQQYDQLCKSLVPAQYPTPISLAQDNYYIELPPIDGWVTITPRNAALFASIINLYEPCKVELNGSSLYRGGRKITHYHFTQPYYWVLCDNRTTSTDSRTFGVLPHSHIVGRCNTILFSIDASQRGFASWRTHRFLQSSQ